MKSLLLVLLNAIAATAFSAIPAENDPVRIFSDSMAKALADGNDSVIFDNMAPAMIEAYGRDALLAPLKQIRSRYGDISSYEIKQSTVGTATAGLRTLRTATIWYALKTSKRDSAAFLQVSITKEGGKFFLARYFVSEFVGDRVPPELRGAL